MKLSWFSRLLRRSPRSRPTSAARRPRAFRPGVEGLEERALLSASVVVVPIGMPTDASHFHSLASALPAAGTGGTVTIEPGASPDAGTVNVTQSNLTIQGDPNVPGSILPLENLDVSGSQVTLANLNLGTVTVDATASHVTVLGAQFGTFTETGAVSGAGHNVLRQNIITGAVTLGGNSGLFQSTDDLVEHNSFSSTAPILLQLINSNGTTIRDNTLVGDAPSAIGIEVRSNSDLVLIANNHVEMTGAGAPIALYLVNTGGAGNILGAQVHDNSLDAGTSGTGLYANVFGTGVGFEVQVEGNDFRGNLVGVNINGVAGATGAGNIDLGGGSNAFGTSKGGNDFRGFNGQNGHFAIRLFNTDAGIAVQAKENIFDAGANPNTVIADGFNGGGTGAVFVSAALDADHAFVQSLYRDLFGRTGDPTPGGEIDGWVAALPALGRAGVVHALLYSTEALDRVVVDDYIRFLGRAPQGGEEMGYVTAIQNGVSEEQVQALFIASPEYQGHINTDYVQSLYINLLGRTGSGQELAAVNAVLPQVGLAGLAAAFAGSTENRMSTLTGYLQELLHRAPKPGEVSALAAQPGDLLSLEAGILGGAEFYAKG
jgi:hypothetical protein